MEPPRTWLESESTRGPASGRDYCGAYTQPRAASAPARFPEAEVEQKVSQVRECRDLLAPVYRNVIASKKSKRERHYLGPTGNRPQPLKVGLRSPGKGVQGAPLASSPSKQHLVASRPAVPKQAALPETRLSATRATQLSVVADGHSNKCVRVGSRSIA